MSDETVQPGDRVLTSGGDQIFPKGLPVGTVTKVSPGPELFLNIRVKPTADLNRLEEVLVITEQEEKEPALAAGEPQIRAADILAQRLPSVPDKPPDDPNKPPPPTSGLKIFSAPTTPATPGAAGIPNLKPSGTGATRPGQASNAANAGPKAQAAAGIANQPAINSSAPKPTGKAPAAKPVATPKAEPPAVKVPDAANAGGESQPAPSKTNQLPDQPAPQPPQEQPQ
jgi:rod shape-determining protein MreC